MRLQFIVLMLFSGTVSAAISPGLPAPRPAEDLPAPTVESLTPLQTAQTSPRRLTEAELTTDPALLSRTLDSAVASENIRAVAYLLPLYRKLPAQQQDRLLILYAEGLQSRAAGNLKAAIARYREMISENPALKPVRLQLALALLNDYQDEAAKTQLEKLQAEEIPEPVRLLVQKGLSVLRERQQWSFDLNGYYRYEKNINGAPRQKELVVGQGKWTFPAPRKAHGIHFDISAGRLLPFKNGWYAKADAGLTGDWFWDAHDYDDFRLRLGLGAGWQDALRNISVQPFVKREIYSGKAYALNVGADMNASYRLAPQWRLSTSVQVMHKKYDNRVWLTGNQYFAGINALYSVNARQYWFGGVNALNSNARDESEAYSRYGISAGVGQEWGGGISARLSVSLARRKYDAPDFFNIQRKQNEYNASLSVWKRDFYFGGITPRLTFEWNKTAGNHFYYNKHDANVYLELSRSF